MARAEVVPKSRLMRFIWNFTLVTSQFEKLNGLAF